MFKPTHKIETSGKVILVRKIDRGVTYSVSEDFDRDPVILVRKVGHGYGVDENGKLWNLFSSKGEPDLVVKKLDQPE